MHGVPHPGSRCALRLRLNNICLAFFSIRLSFFLPRTRVAFFSAVARQPARRGSASRTTTNKEEKSGNASYQITPFVHGHGALWDFLGEKKEPTIAKASRYKTVEVPRRHTSERTRLVFVVK